MAAVPAGLRDSQPVHAAGMAATFCRCYPSTCATWAVLRSLWGWSCAAEALSQFTSAPVLGQLSDRFGRKRILLVSQLTGSVSLLMLAVAPGIVMVMFARPCSE